jgi:hypothetical protein
MAEGVEPREERLVRLLAILLVSGAAVRLLAAIVAGFLDWYNGSGPFLPSGRARAYDVLTTFGAGGDGAGVVLAIIAALVVWWLCRRADPLAATLRTSVCWVLGITAVLAICQAVGIGLFLSLDPNRQTFRIVLSSGFALAALLIAGGAIVLTRRFGALVDERLAADDIDAFVFAVDRHTGDARAFYSVRDAVRRMHIYSVEENEFDYYTDEGVVLRASVVDDRIELQPTDEERSDELVEKLKDFANRRGLTIDEADADDPTAYVDPVNRWQWLDMWPPWMRPLGYVFRRR